MRQRLGPLSSSHTEEDHSEQTLRPRNLSDYFGQERIKESLKISIAAAKKREEALDHVLFHGPPGLGKTTLAMSIMHLLSYEGYIKICENINKKQKKEIVENEPTVFSWS